MTSKALAHWNFFYLGIFLEALIIVISLIESESQVQFLQAIARYSGRISFFYFALIFIHAAVFPRVDEALNTILFHRSFVVYFCILHLIHLGFLLAYNLAADTTLIPTRLAGGILAYVILVIYPISLFLTTEKKWMTIFRQVYLYYLFFIFFMTYWPRILGQLPEVSGRIETYYALFTLLLFFLGLHIALRILPSFRNWVQNLPVVRSF